MTLYMDSYVNVGVTARPGCEEKTEAHRDQKQSGQASPPYSQVTVDVDPYPYPYSTE